MVNQVGHIVHDSAPIGQNHLDVEGVEVSKKCLILIKYVDFKKKTM